MENLIKEIVNRENVVAHKLMQEAVLNNLPDGNKHSFTKYVISELKLGLDLGVFEQEGGLESKVFYYKRMLGDNNSGVAEIHKTIQAKGHMLQELNQILGNVTDQDYVVRGVNLFLKNRTFFGRQLQNIYETDKIFTGDNANILEPLRKFQKYLELIQTNDFINIYGWKLNYITNYQLAKENPITTQVDRIHVSEITNLMEKVSQSNLGSSKPPILHLNEVVEILNQIINFGDNVNNVSVLLFSPITLNLATCLAPMAGVRMAHYLFNSDSRTLDLLRKLRDQLNTKIILERLRASYTAGVSLLTTKNISYVIGASSVSLGLYSLLAGRTHQIKPIALNPAVSVFLSVMADIKLNAKAIAFSLTSTFSETVAQGYRGIREPGFEFLNDIFKLFTGQYDLSNRVR